RQGADVEQRLHRVVAVGGLPVRVDDAAQALVEPILAAPRAAEEVFESHCAPRSSVARRGPQVALASEDPVSAPVLPLVPLLSDGPLLAVLLVTAPLAPLLS